VNVKMVAGLWSLQLPCYDSFWSSGGMGTDKLIRKLPTMRVGVGVIVLV
jgi:hypothetical protein